MSTSIDSVLLRLALRHLENGRRDKCSDLLALAQMTGATNNATQLVEGLLAHSSGQHQRAVELFTAAEASGLVDEEIAKSFRWLKNKSLHFANKQRRQGEQRGEAPEKRFAGNSGLSGPSRQDGLSESQFNQVNSPNS